MYVEDVYVEDVYVEDVYVEDVYVKEGVICVSTRLESGITGRIGTTLL